MLRIEDYASIVDLAVEIGTTGPRKLWPRPRIALNRALDEDGSIPREQKVHVLCWLLSYVEIRILAARKPLALPKSLDPQKRLF